MGLLRLVPKLAKQQSRTHADVTPEVTHAFATDEQSRHNPQKLRQANRKGHRQCGGKPAIKTHEKDDRNGPRQEQSDSEKRHAQTSAPRWNAWREEHAPSAQGSGHAWHTRMDHSTPQWWDERQQDHCRISLGKLRALLMNAQRLIATLRKQMMIGVALQFEQEHVRSGKPGLPGMLWTKLFEDSGSDLVAG